MIRIQGTFRPRVYWNATFGSPEFQRFFSLSTGPLSPDYSQEKSGSFTDALAYFSRIGASLGTDSLQLDIREMESYYQGIQNEKSKPA